MKIAVCITTHNRPEVLAKSLEKWSDLLSVYPKLEIFVVDDASSIKVPSDFRFDQRVGIPAAKNKCIELAMSYGAEHIFLADDDVYPIDTLALDDYINSPYKHMCFSFLNPYRIKDGYKHHALGNGCMMYIHREVVDSIGGFDKAFGIGKYEHTQFSHRAYAAGFCPHPYVDVINSDKLFYSMDKHQEVERTFTSDEMKRQLESGRDHFYKTLKDTSFYEYIN